MKPTLRTFLCSLFAPEKDIDELERTIESLEDEVRRLRTQRSDTTTSHATQPLSREIERLESALDPLATLSGPSRASYLGSADDVFAELPADPDALVSKLKSEVQRLFDENSDLHARLEAHRRELDERRGRLKKIGGAILDAAVFE